MSQAKPPKKPARLIMSPPKSVATNTTKKPKFGKPLVKVTFKRIKFFVTVFLLLFLIMTLLSLDLIISAIKIRTHLGYFLNMISKGDGEVLPALQALPVAFFLVLNLLLLAFVYRMFRRGRGGGTNQVLFVLIMVGVVMVLGTLVTIFLTLGHAYGPSKGIEDGIMKAMKKYSINSFYKKEIDRLQIEFQCCGSSKYDDWYNVSWMEKDMSLNATTSQIGKTPFSCCAMRTRFPCIHFDIETTGVNYLYTPEFNFSISPIGCHKKVVQERRQVGIGVVGSLFLYVFLEILLLIPARFLQTGHSVNGQFEGNKKTYTVWLLGSYSGGGEPPEPPPVPPELMN